MESIATLIAKKWFLAISLVAFLSLFLISQTVIAVDTKSRPRVTFAEDKPRPKVSFEKTRPKVAIFDISNTLVSKEKDFEQLTPEQQAAFSGKGIIHHDGKDKEVRVNDGLIERIKEMQADHVLIFINSTGKTSPDSIQKMLSEMGVDVPTEHIFVANHGRGLASQFTEFMKSKYGEGVYNKSKSSYKAFKELEHYAPDQIAFYDDNKQQRKWAEEAGWQVHEPWEYLSEKKHGKTTGADESSEQGSRSKHPIYYEEDHGIKGDADGHDDGTHALHEIREHQEVQHHGNIDRSPEPHQTDDPGSMHEYDD